MRPYTRAPSIDEAVSQGGLEALVRFAHELSRQYYSDTLRLDRFEQDRHALRARKIALENRVKSAKRTAHYLDPLAASKSLVRKLDRAVRTALFEIFDYRGRH